MWSRLRSLWRNTVHRRRADRDLDDEVAVAFDLAVAEQIRRGVDPDRARRLATLQFGRPIAIAAQVRERSAPARRSTTSLADLAVRRTAARARSPLLRDHRDRLARARHRRDHHHLHAGQRADAARSPRRRPGAAGRDRPESRPTAAAAASPTRSTSGCATTTRSSAAWWRSRGAWSQAESTRTPAPIGRVVSENFFDVLQVPPQVGRLIAPSDADPGQRPSRS